MDVNEVERIIRDYRLYQFGVESVALGGRRYILELTDFRGFIINMMAYFAVNRFSHLEVIYDAAIARYEVADVYHRRAAASFRFMNRLFATILPCLRIECAIVPREQLVESLCEMRRMFSIYAENLRSGRTLAGDDMRIYEKLRAPART